MASLMFNGKRKKGMVISLLLLFHFIHFSEQGFFNEHGLSVFEQFIFLGGKKICVMCLCVGFAKHINMREK